MLIDINIYKEQYYEEYKDFFNILKNTKEDIKIINKSKKELEEEALKQEENENYDPNLISDKEDSDDNNKNSYNIPICLECKKHYSNQLNEFYLCNQCLLNNIKTALLTSYIEFILNKSNMINAKENLRVLIQVKACFNSEVQGLVSVQKAINNSKFKFDDIFNEVRSELCLNCAKNLKSKNNYFIKLPCECRICSQQCFFQYVEALKKYLNLYAPNVQYVYVKVVHFLQCFCGFFYHTYDIFYMIEELEKRKLKEQKEVYQDYIKIIWIWRCMNCFIPFSNNNQFYRVNFDTDKIDKKILKSKKDLKHLLCPSCHKKFKDKKVVICNICEFEHQIDKIVKVDEDNEEESCIIF